MPATSLSPLQLDIACLRHLVSRHQLAQVIFPSSDTLGEFQRVLRLLHGFGYHTHFVSLQVLHTALFTISDCLQSLHSANKLAARPILEMVNLTLRLGLDTDVFTIELQEVLLVTCIHAALGWLPHVPRDDWQSTYRYLLSLLRKRTWAPEMIDLRNVGVKNVKAIVIHMHRLADDEPEKMRDYLRGIIADFNKHHPWKNLHPVLLRHVARIAEMLPDLSFRDQEEAMAQQQVREEPGEEDLPGFFSDVEAGVEADKMKVNTAGQDAQFSPMASDSDFEADAELLNDNRGWEKRNERSSGRRRSRRSARGSAPRSARRVSGKKLEERNQDETGSNEDSAMDDGDDESNVSRAESEKPPKVDGRRLRPRKAQENMYRELSDDTLGDRASQEVNEQYMQEMAHMDSDAFSSDTSRGDKVPHNQKSKRKKRGRQVVKPIVDSSREEVQGPHGKVQEAGSESEKIDSDMDEEELGGIEGPQGEALRGLQDAASNLRSARLSDPLLKAMEEAQRAQRRRRSQLKMFSPCENARAASPIPESEATLRRKKRSRAILDSGSDSDFQDRKPRGKVQKYCGKVLRSGRFRIFEDELLKDGLEKYGWGAWTNIANNFGNSEYTRTPMSLKDRARTLGLDPAAYHLRRLMRGRPNPRLQKRKVPNHEEHDDNIEQPSPTHSVSHD